MHKVLHELRPGLIAEAIQILQRSPYFKSVNPGTLADAFRHASTLTLDAGEVLINEGEAANDQFFILLSGQLDVTQEGNFILKIKVPGQFIGEMAVINREPRIATVTAQSPTKVVAIDAAAMSDPERADPSLALATASMLNQVLAEKLRITTERAKLYESALLETREIEEYSQELEEEIQKKLEEIKLYSQVVENNQDPIIVVDNEGLGHISNEAFQHTLGYSADAVSGLPIGTVIEDFLAPKQAFHEQYPSEWKGERNVLCHDKSVFPASIAISPIVSRDGSVRHYAIEIRDITLQKDYENSIIEKTVELKATYQVLEETVNDLEKSNRIKNEFFSHISAQLKTPLITIHSFADFLIKRYSDNIHQNVQEFLSKILIEEQKLENLVENMLTMSELNLDISELSLSVFKLESLLSDIDVNANILLKESRKDAKAQKNTLIGDREKLCKALSECAVYIQEHRLDKLKSIYLYYDYDLSQDSHKLVLSNRKLSQREPTPRPHTLGHGIEEKIEEIDLHLPLAKRIIELHKGQIQLGTEQDSIRLIIRLPSEPEQGLIHIPRVMLIDQHVGDRSTYFKIVDESIQPIEISEFQDPVAAINALNAFAPDLVVVDPLFDASHLSPEELIKELINANSQRADFIVVSKLVEDAHFREALLRHGIKDYLAKPILVDEFSLRFNAVFSSHMQLSILSKNVQKAQQSAVTDVLTQVFNRRYYDKFISEQLNKAQLQGSQCSVILLDIDHFKNYNDTNGHQVGDKGLKITASVLKRSVRVSDMVARYGGEEFVIVLPGTSKHMAAHIAEKIRLGIESESYPNEENQPNGKVTVSLGVATFPEHGDTPELLLKAADHCLYIAKEKGRNCVITANGFNENS